jgi:hypothetical protein
VHHSRCMVGFCRCSRPCRLYGKRPGPGGFRPYRRSSTSPQLLESVTCAFQKSRPHCGTVPISL